MELGRDFDEGYRMVRSLRVAIGPFFLTDSTPFSIADAEEYISLLPITSWFFA